MPKDPQTEALPLVVLARVRSPTELKLIKQWAEANHPGATFVAEDDAALPQQLGPGEDKLVVPVRVTWLPRERPDGRRVRASDLLLLTNPHRPWAALQPRIAAREPDRANITVGEGASTSDMRARFEEETGRSAEGVPFAEFVVRQATLACERAQRAVIGDRYKVPRLVAEQITATARFRQQVAKLAETDERSFAEVMDYATDCLSELAAVQSRLAIDLFRMVLSPMHANAWEVEVDLASLDRLREVNRKHALVFLPSHRSYADPLVLAEVLAEHDFPRNHLLGGENMSFWPIGPLGKRAGVIFIRRSFGEDKVYKLAMREYLGHLVAKRFNLEWYIEGGRTRTGKLRPPRYGLLHYLARAVDEGRAEDVMLVPVSMVYDQLHEVSAMAAEQVGQAKQREGMKWLGNYIKAQMTSAGAAQIRFGDPISLRTALDEAGDEARLEKVAFRICDGINRATPVTSTSLVTFALLGTDDRALSIDQVGRVVTPLLDLLEQRHVAGPIAELRRAAALRLTLDSLTAAGVVQRYDGGTEPVWSIAPGRHRVAAFYRNGVLHHLINRALVEIALLRLASAPVEEGDPLEAAWEEALRVRDLLKFEFFFADKVRFREELAEEVALLPSDWRERISNPSDAEKLLGSSGPLVAHRALRSFFDAQLVVAERLAARESRAAIDKAAFLDECVGVGRQMLLQGRLNAEESVSSELFSAAWSLAENRDVVDPGREEVAIARKAFLCEVEAVVDSVVRIGALDAAQLEEVLDDHSL
jgi:glycerol-3-phosphate O-acyltransferase